MLIDKDTVVDCSHWSLVIIPPHCHISNTSPYIETAPSSFGLAHLGPGKVKRMATNHVGEEGCVLTRTIALSSCHPLLEAENGDGIGHDSIAEDENVVSATNPKPCAGQCKGSVAPR